MKIPELIRSCRKQNNLSLSEFSRTIGIDKGSVSRWENEKRELKAESVVNLAQKLRIDQNILLKLWLEDVQTYAEKRKKGAK